MIPGMTALPALDGATFTRDPTLLADALHAAGACWIAGWPDAPTTAALRADLLRLVDAGQLRPASVGRLAGRTLHAGIRGDTTLWLDDPACGDVAHGFLTALDGVRTMLNRTLYLSLDEVEAHYAAYPTGTGYARHRDRFRDSDARVVTWVTYLNAEWSDGDGGAIRLYPPDDAPLGTAPVDCLPIGGSVCFLSEREHEVLPALRQRLSIAAWFRRRTGLR